MRVWHSSYVATCQYDRLVLAVRHELELATCKYGGLVLRVGLWHQAQLLDEDYSHPDEKLDFGLEAVVGVEEEEELEEEAEEVDEHGDTALSSYLGVWWASTDSTHSGRLPTARRYSEYVICVS